MAMDDLKGSFGLILWEMVNFNEIGLISQHKGIKHLVEHIFQKLIDNNFYLFSVIKLMFK